MHAVTGARPRDSKQDDKIQDVQINSFRAQIRFQVIEIHAKSYVIEVLVCGGLLMRKSPS